MSETTTETAAAETSGDSTAPTEATATATEESTTEVRDATKLLNAYEAEKAKRKEQDSALRELRTELDAIKAKAEGKEAEFTAQQEAQRVKDEALGAANERIKKAEVRAAAAAKLADPADALRFLDLSAIEVNADGEVDSAAVTSAIDDLIKQKPYLAAQGKRFQGTADGGARNDASKPAQLTRADLAGMSPEAIVEAKAQGRLSTLLGT